MYNNVYIQKCWVASQITPDLTSRHNSDPFISQTSSRYTNSITFTSSWATMYCLTSWPFTLKHSPYWFSNSKAPNLNTWVTLNRPEHLYLNFPRNNRSFKLNNNTESPWLNSLYSICLSWYSFILSLYRVDLSYALSRNSPISFVYSSVRFTASLQLMFSFVNAHSALCSSCTGK